VTRQHSHVSLLANVQPSPDWFVGISAFDLCSVGSAIECSCHVLFVFSFVFLLR
jgi:hypothetical protein